MAVVQRILTPELDANPRVAIGNNRPPIDIEAKAAFDEALDEKEGFRARVESLLGAADRATATDEESAGRCGELVKQIRAASSYVDKTHETTKAPYLLAGRVIDAAKNELVGPLKVAKDKVEAKQTQFVREENARRDAEARRAREAEEARRREEWERQQAEAAAARAAAIAEAKANAAPEPVEVEPAPPPPAPVIMPEPERQIIRGDYGAAVSAKKEWYSTVEDYEVAFMAVSNNDKVREAIDRAVANMVRGGVHEIAGVRIWSDVKVSNR